MCIFVLSITFLFLLNTQTEVVITTKEIKSLQGQTFYLNEPQSFVLTQSKIIQADIPGLSCRSISQQTYTDIRSYYQLPSQQLPVDPQVGWRTQIVSATSLQNDNYIYILLSNGNILKLIKNEGLRLEMSDRYEAKGINATWFQGQLVSSNGQLYWLFHGRLSRLFFDRNSWSAEKPLLQETIIKVINTRVCPSCQEGRVTLSKKYLRFLEKSNFSNLLESQNGDFIDFSVDLDTQTLVVLSQQKVIWLRLQFVNGSYSTQKLEQIVLLQQPYAKKIAVKGNKLLIYYQRHSQEVLQQLSWIISNQKVDLKYIKIIPKLYKIDDFLQLENFAIIDQYFQLTIVPLNIASSISNQAMISFEYDSIVQIKQYNTQKDELIMLVLPNSLQLVTFHNTIQHSNFLLKGAMACSIQKQGHYSLTVNFKGICNSNKTLQCQQKIQYNIEVRPNQHNLLKLGIFTIVSIVFVILVVTVISTIICQKVKLSIDIAEQKRLLKQETKSSQIKTQTQDKLPKSQNKKRYEE